MSNIIKEDQGSDYQDLYEELEVRYGAGLAQGIVDQIKKTEDQDNKPDYLSVKALSEVLEVFRADAQKAIKDLKKLQSNVLPLKVTDLEESRLKSDLKKYFKCYWLVQHSFYQTYGKALKICEVPETYRYDRYTKPTEMNLAHVPARMLLFNKAA